MLLGKGDLTEDEKTKIVNWLSEGYNTTETVKMLSHDYCIIKRFGSVRPQRCKKMC